MSTTTTVEIIGSKTEAAIDQPILNIATEEKKPQEEPVGKNWDRLATGGYPFAGIPVFDDHYKKRQWQLEHMAGAFRVFARKGYTEGSAGHISVRDPVDPNTFWINP